MLMVLVLTPGLSSSHPFYCSVLYLTVLYWTLCLSTCSASQQLKLSRDQIKYLCEEATRAGTQGQRAEIFACEVARASAGERRGGNLSPRAPTDCFDVGDFFMLYKASKLVSKLGLKSNVLGCVCVLPRVGTSGLILFCFPRAFPRRLAYLRHGSL